MSCAIYTVVGLLALLLLAPATEAAVHLYSDPSIVPKYSGFIQVQGGRFVDANCNEFPVTGLNTWDLMETAAGYVFPANLPRGVDAVQFTMRTAAANGLTVVRAFGHGHDPWSVTLQPHPGKYNETALWGLDYILDTAAKAGVRVLFTMADNWKMSDSKSNYVWWAGKTDLDTFWTDADVKQLYKNHLDFITSRVNSINGKRYRDDPTIFAWDLINEPRCDCFPPFMPPPDQWYTLPKSCKPSCADTVTAWVEEMAAHLKAVDPNHLVTVGEEGFWAAGAYDAAITYDPGNYGGLLGWASLTGQNFTAQHAPKAVDFCAAHYWPDMWTLGEDDAFFKNWVAGHNAACSALGKPFVLEEFGKNVSNTLSAHAIAAERNPTYDVVFGEYQNSLASGGNLRGLILWKWGLSPVNSGIDPNEVAALDSTFTDIVSPNAQQALAWFNQAPRVAACMPVAAASGGAAAVSGAAAAAGTAAGAAAAATATPSQAIAQPAAQPAQAGLAGAGGAAAQASPAGAGGAAVQAAPATVGGGTAQAGPAGMAVADPAASAGQVDGTGAAAGLGLGLGAQDGGPPMLPVPDSGPPRPARASLIYGPFADGAGGAGGAGSSLGG